MHDIRTLGMTWASGASQLIGELFDLSRPHLEGQTSDLEEPVRFVSAQLYIDCHLSSESVLILISNLKEWDADLINRAVIEGTVKYVYLMDGDPKDRARKAFEYWDLMPDFMSIKRSERAKAFLQEVEDPDANEWRPFKEIVISDKEVEERRHGMNRIQRSSMEHDWSFSGIMQRYAKSENPGLRFMTHFAHGYGMSSHLIHKDGDGVGMVWERYRRDPERQNAVKIGHLARLTSDVCAFAKFRTARLLKACDKDVSSINEVASRYKWLDESLGEAGSRFSQAEYGAAQ